VSSPARSAVHQETVIGIVETMKDVNSVPAAVRGKVVDICLGNAEFPERGAVLMTRADPEAP
jgi:acetyl-CoA carboxylase biotin carboxyl carrier protein